MTKAERILLAFFILCLLAGCGSSDDREAIATADAHLDSHAGHDNHDSNGLQAMFSFSSGEPRAKEKEELAVHITDETGKPIKDFEQNHEKLLHLIIVSKDLSYFSHLHPAYEGNGIFRVPLTFPAGGKYRVFTDFKPVRGESTTLGEWLKVEGAPGKTVSVQVDQVQEKVVGDKEISLSTNKLKVNEEATLTFSIRDARTKEQIRDLEPYLGATGHVVILSRDADHYLHVHPLDEASSGPDAQFVTSFPKPGIYKIWGQFQHRGEVFTVPFVVQVE